MKRRSILIIGVLLVLAGAWHVGLIPLQTAEAQQGVLTASVTHGPLTATHATMHLELKDDGVTVISRNYSESYTQAVGLTVEVRNSIQRQMQEAIDEYRKIKAEKARPGYIDAPGTIEANLDLTKEL